MDLEKDCVHLFQCHETGLLVVYTFSHTSGHRVYLFPASDFASGEVISGKRIALSNLTLHVSTSGALAFSRSMLRVLVNKGDTFDLVTVESGLGPKIAATGNREWPGWARKESVAISGTPAPNQ